MTVNNVGAGRVGASAYEEYVRLEEAAERTPLSLEAWLSSLEGNPGVNWRDDVNAGAWDASTAYIVRDGVSHEGAVYRALRTTTAGEEPGVVTAAWALIIEAPDTTLYATLNTQAANATSAATDAAAAQLAAEAARDAAAVAANGVYPDLSTAHAALSTGDFFVVLENSGTDGYSIYEMLTDTTSTRRAGPFADLATIQAEIYRQKLTGESPGLVLDAYTKNLDLSPTGGDAIDTATSVNGALRLTNIQRNVAQRAVVPVASGRRFALDFGVRRVVDSADNIAIGFVCLDASYAEVDRIFVNNAVASADGDVFYRKVVGEDNTADGVDWEWDSNTVYIRPYILPAGSSHTTDIIRLSVTDISDQTENPGARLLSESDTIREWTVDTAWESERRMKLKAGGPVIIKPSTDQIRLIIGYGDSTASNRSAGWHLRIPEVHSPELFPHAVMLDTTYAPGLLENTAAVSSSSLLNYDDRRFRRTSSAALGQPESIGTALKFVRYTRERRLEPVLRGYTAAGIAGANLEHIVKGGTAKDGVDMYTRLTNCIARWITLATSYGLSVVVEAIHLSIGSNDIAADFSGTVAAYRADVEALITDLQTDIAAQTGQSDPVLVMFGTTASTNEALKPSLALAEIADANRGSTTIIPMGPEYQYPFASTNHMDVDAVVLQGERLAHRIILGFSGANAPVVLYPSGAVWGTDAVTITVADATQLVIDTDSLPAHDNYGFSCDTATISSVTIVGTNQITVSFDSTVPSGTVLSYAQGPHTDSALAQDMTGMSRAWGNIRNERNTAYNIRGEAIPAFDEFHGVFGNRVHNGRQFFHDDWLNNLEITKP